MSDGISEVELQRGKGQLRGGLVLGLEDSMSRMSRIGKGELVNGEILSIDEILRRIDAVTIDQVRGIAADLLAAPRRQKGHVKKHGSAKFGRGAALGAELTTKLPREKKCGQI